MTRAWTIVKGTAAPGAAGVIHTDFEKGFIRAETIAYRDFVALGGEAGAKEAGKMRLEGELTVYCARRRRDAFSFRKLIGRPKNNSLAEDFGQGIWQN